MNSARILFLLLAMCALATLAVGEAPTSLFQLNGYAGSPAQPGSDFCPAGSGTHCTDPVVPANCDYGAGATAVCDNWNLLNGSTGHNGGAGHSKTHTFFDPVTQVFSKGTKDTQDISQWSWAPHGSPGKDTFNAGYAAAYIGPYTGDLLLMFGADRASSNGDANIGAWFFQLPVIPNANGSFSCGLAAGQPCHVNHDVFVTSQFISGGGSSYITVYEWDTGCASISSTVSNPSIGSCADTNLRLLANPSTVCGSSAYCAITNPQTTHTSWEGAIATPQFFVGGVDITAALAGFVTTPPCFTKYMVETRSAQSSGAELKAFLLGSFNVCAISVTKACSGTPSVVSHDGVSYLRYTFTGNVHNDGQGTLYALTVNDTFPIGSSNTALTQPTTPEGGLLPGADAIYNGSFDIQTTGLIHNTVTATASSLPGGTPLDITQDHTGAAASATANFGGTTPSCNVSTNPSLTLTKSCTVGLTAGKNGVVLTLNDTITACNMSQDGTTISGITLTNSVLLDGINGSDQSIDGATNFSLPPPQLGNTANCATFTPSYTPTACVPNGSTAGGVCEFSDTVRVDSKPKDQYGNDVPSTDIDGPQNAICHICPFGSCTAQNVP